MATLTLEHTFDTVAIDQAIAELQTHADEWARLPIKRKIVLLTQIRERLGEYAQAWVDASVTGKKLDPSSPLVGEEWSSGPWALAAALNALIATLNALQQGKMPKIKKVRTRANGQLVLQVYPNSIYDKLLTDGVSAEVWMHPTVNKTNLNHHIGTFYKQRNPSGNVALVLGAGNINSIAPLDVLYKLIADGEVAILKMNPVNDYLGPIIAEIFQPLSDAGYFRIVYGGADVGAYLVAHEGVDSIHITGSERTHDIIVYGAGAEGAARKAQNDPILDKPITSELGGIGGVIVVPGPWDDADVAYQAEHIASLKLHNAGCNCIAAQVLILPREWERSTQLLDAVRTQLQTLPPRPHYYPGAEKRIETAIAETDGKVEQFAACALITGLDPDDDNEHCYSQEFFATALAQTSLAGSDPATFLRNAVAFANDKLDGTLGVQLLIHPKTIKQLGNKFEQALADLRYGTIGVNIWSGVGFNLPHVAWGAYPGHTLDDIQSGIGVVHNAFLLDKTEKNILYGPFWESPRGIKHGYFGTLPKPPWFVTNKSAETTTRLVTDFYLKPKITKLPAIFASALRG